MILGFMGIFGFPLDTGTIMVASIAIGISVDDTIHFTYQLLRSIRTEEEFRPALLTAVRKIGRPIAASTVVLASGFFTLGFSYFQPTANAGILCGITIFFALAADLFVAPGLFQAYFQRRRQPKGSNYEM